MNRHHTTWLQLLEISGPFLTLPILGKVFPAGLDQLDGDVVRELRQQIAIWREQSHLKDQSKAQAAHQTWVRFVLEQVLEWPANALIEGQGIPPSLSATPLEAQGEVIRPDLMLANPPRRIVSLLDVAGAGDAEVGHPRLLMQVWPAGQDLELAPTGQRSTLKPSRRMLELLRASEVRLGLITNGEQWMLVDAPAGGTPAYVSWFVQDWLDEPLTLAAFYSLLCARRFFSVGADETLEGLLAKSADFQHDVTDQLGLQVRRAVEVLIQAIDAADHATQGELLAGHSTQTAYEAALTG